MDGVGLGCVTQIVYLIKMSEKRIFTVMQLYLKRNSIQPRVTLFIRNSEIVLKEIVQEIKRRKTFYNFTPTSQNKMLNFSQSKLLNYLQQP